MSAEVRRVPLDFDWPLNEVWRGYVLPAYLRAQDCPTCGGGGYAPHARHLHDLWYGYVPFDPTETGSSPLRHDTPAVRAFAERNVSSSPDFYGKGEEAIVREATRLARLWNGQWCHHLSQDDVDAPVAAGRLMDLTHTWERGVGWTPKDPPAAPTAAEVNEWSLTGLSHDSINAAVAIEARCQREGGALHCPACEGRGTLEAYQGQRAEAEAWEPTPPPQGDGWQLWETVSEGSPVSPVFATDEELARWISGPETAGTSRHVAGFEGALAFVRAGSSVGSFLITGGGQLVSGMEAVAFFADSGESS